MESSCACVDFLRLSSTSTEDRTDYGDGYIIRRLTSLDERRQISESADNCQLCGKIYDILDDLYGDEYYLPNNEDAPYVASSFNCSSLDGEGHLISSMKLSCDKATRRSRPYSVPEIGFAAWADQGTPASTEFVNWSPIFHGSVDESARLARRLLDNCESLHKDCRLKDPAGEFALPSRVLRIGDDAENISVKLVESTYLSGSYCALSHCWGPKNNQPLQTITTNITDHLSSIPWNRLPPLFKDAVTLTRNIGIEYLWIDSLCIVQDDKQDWLDESNRMALIYQRATLVIAAVGSENSAQRLSKTDRPRPLTLRVPYYAQNGSTQGSYNMSESMPLVSVAELSLDGPLRERGWAFQEWYLGRRKLFFTSKGIMWSCNECEVNERGNSEDLVLYENTSWLHCLKEYTRKHLTYSSDRIVALWGVVAELKKSRKDSFVYDFGIWEGQLAEQLLWRPAEVRSRNEDLPKLPSWSWAATGGSKVWVQGDDLQQAIVNGSSQIVKLKESRSLNASGELFRAELAPVPLRHCCIKHYEKASRQTPVEVFEQQILPGWVRERYDIRRFPILNQNGARDPLGLALFDGSAYYPECFLFILNSSRRNSYDPCSPEFRNRSFGDEDTSDGNPEDVCQRLVHRDTIDCIDIVEVGQSTEAYWALLLQPVHGKSKTFKRVGIALLWPRALKEAKGEVTEFEIK